MIVFTGDSAGAGGGVVWVTTAGSGAGEGRSASFLDRKLSTIAAISSRCMGARFGCEIGLATTGLAVVRGALTGFVSKATRLISIRWIGETLSDVTLPPHEPQPSVIDGARSVEKPIAPCVVG